MHTPGPWELNDSRWPNCIVAPKALDGALSLARVCEYRYLKEEDANLMIAAPNMLKACEILAQHEVSVNGICTYCNTDHNEFPDVNCPVYLARIAIAKAKGANP